MEHVPTPRTLLTRQMSDRSIKYLNNEGRAFFFRNQVILVMSLLSLYYVTSVVVFIRFVRALGLTCLIHFVVLIAALCQVGIDRRSIVLYSNPNSSVRNECVASEEFGSIGPIQGSSLYVNTYRFLDRHLFGFLAYLPLWSFRYSSRVLAQRCEYAACYIEGCSASSIFMCYELPALMKQNARVLRVNFFNAENDLLYSFYRKNAYDKWQEKSFSLTRQQHVSLKSALLLPQHAVLENLGNFRGSWYRHPPRLSEFPLFVFLVAVANCAVSF